MWPTSALAILTICCEMPPRVMISPASMKNGIAISGKLSAPEIRYCAMIWVLKLSSVPTLMR